MISKTSLATAKKTLIAVLKWSFALALLAYVLRSGKLSLSDLQSFITHPYIALCTFSMLILVVLLSFYRWKLLLKGLDMVMDYSQAVKLGMIGLFFSAIIPGAVSGDLVKAVYVARLYPNRKARAVTTVLLDRVLGLLSLVLLGAISFVIGFGALAELKGPMAGLMMTLGWGICITGTVFIVALAAFPTVANFLPPELPKVFRKVPKSRLFNELYQALLGYKARPKVLWNSVFVSLLSQLINVFLLWLIAVGIFGYAVVSELSVSAFVIGSVLGSCAVAFPLAPMGLGVGQVAYSAIFGALGAPVENFGAAIVTGLQLIQLLLSLCGLGVFLFYRSEIHQLEVDTSAVATWA